MVEVFDAIKPESPSMAALITWHFQADYIEPDILSVGEHGDAGVIRLRVFS